MNKQILRRNINWVIIICLVLGLAACASPTVLAGQPGTQPVDNAAAATPTVTFTLVTGMSGDRMVYVGKGGSIDGQVDPNLPVQMGDVVKIVLVNGDGMQHDITFPDFKATTPFVQQKDETASVVFTVDKNGQFPYYCLVPGHRQAGMEGKLVVGNAEDTANLTAPSISRDPADLPGPVGDRPPQTVRVDLTAEEMTGQLADGATYTYWTFNGQVPGPFIRVKLGDTVEVHLKNLSTNTMSHSVDFHAVTGPGGGAVMTTTTPGGETSFTFKTLNPGLFVYHCATPMVAEHIANGMFGMILVEPEGGLPPVDHEFYVMQSEIYTQQPYGSKGALDFSPQKLMDEQPEYFVFNGAVGSLTTEHPLHAKVGETVRIFFGVGGPNFVSSFHMIGEIFDRVYDEGSLTSQPLTNVQTTLVPPGGSTVVEFTLQVPGRYMLVDHAIVRMERGLSGYLLVDGAANPDIYQGTPQPGSGH